MPAIDRSGLGKSFAQRFAGGLVIIRGSVIGDQLLHPVHHQPGQAHGAAGALESLMAFLEILKKLYRDAVAFTL